MTMMEREPDPLAPTSIDQHQIGQLKSQIGNLAADVKQLTQAVQKLVATEAKRAQEMHAFAESATNDRSIVMQMASMIRDLASRSERQTEAITVLIDANSKLAGLVNGMLDLCSSSIAENGDADEQATRR